MCVRISVARVTHLACSERQVRRLKHPNVNQLIGACVELGNICLVWGYSPKGSMRDVLQNENYRLDWMFKLSFIADIAKASTSAFGYTDHFYPFTDPACKISGLKSARTRLVCKQYIPG